MPLPEILHYVGYPEDRGGIVATIYNVAAVGRYRCVLGVVPGFTSTRERPLPYLAFPAVAAERLGPTTWWRARAVATQVRAWLAADQARIFHGHSRAGLAVAWWLHRAGEKRVVASVHCYGKQRWMYRLMARQLGDRLYWLSPAMKRYYGLDVPAGRAAWAQCIPGGVPRVAVPRTQGFGREIVRLGGAGSLVAWKQWHLVLDGMARMRAEQRWKVRFIHIGGTDGTPESERYALALRTQTSALGLGPLVDWRGAQPSSAGLLEEVDALVVPSHREPLSMAMLEALAAGVPVLAANSGGLRDVIAPTQNGWLFRSGDPRDVARALTLLVETDALRTVQPAPPDDWRFAAPAVADQWAKVYASMVSVGY